MSRPGLYEAAWHSFTGRVLYVDWTYAFGMSYESILTNRAGTLLRGTLLPRGILVQLRTHWDGRSLVIE